MRYLLILEMEVKWENIKNRGSKGEKKGLFHLDVQE